MAFRYEEGKYVVILDKSGQNILARGRLNGVNNSFYIIIDKDGNEISFNVNDVVINSYENYSDDLFYISSRYLESVDYIKEALIRVLGDRFCEAPTISEQYKPNDDILKKNDEVIIYPVYEKKFHTVNELEKGIIVEVSEYDILDNNNNLIHLPKYNVETFDGFNYVIIGNDGELSSYFIGKEDKFVSTLVNMMYDNLEQIEKIEKLREELYVESKGTNRDERVMRIKLDYTSPFKK